LAWWSGSYSPASSPNSFWSCFASMSISAPFGSEDRM